MTTEVTDAQRARVWSRVTLADGCWPWTGGIDRNGYGYMWAASTTQTAHRVVYGLLVGPIPPGLELDHLCNIRHCVRPDHLEPVTTAENQRRRRHSHCIRGHELADHNVRVSGGSRGCITCHREDGRAQRTRERLARSEGIPA